MKMKHNKKRNTAFIFEALIRELTKAVVAQDKPKQKKIIKIIRENFKGRTLLAKDLEAYKTILESKDLDKKTAEKLIFEARMIKMSINHKVLFEMQSEVIDLINKEVSPEVFNNFVPNYKDLATVFQIFHPRTKAKQRVLLENQVIENMLSGEAKERESIKPIDNLTYKTFVKKFNEKYGESLLSEQKELLKHYIGSFSDNGIDLKAFLSEEIGRLREVVESSTQLTEVKQDGAILEGTQKVLNVIDGFKQRDIDNKFIHDVLKIQNLAKEIEE